MSCTPADLLAWSDRIVGQTSTESERRAALAHAYYACYHMYANGIASIIPERASGKHEMLVQIGLYHAAPQTVKQQRDKIEKVLDTLDSLRKSRGIAHYELDKAITGAKLQQCLDDAHAIIDSLFNVGKWVASTTQGAKMIPRK